MTQEGHVMKAAGCTAPVLDDEDIAYTREVLTPFLDTEINGPSSSASLGMRQAARSASPREV
jgi:hypothetical protein